MYSQYQAILPGKADITPFILRKSIYSLHFEYIHHHMPSEICNNITPYERANMAWLHDLANVCVRKWNKFVSHLKWRNSLKTSPEKAVMLYILIQMFQDWEGYIQSAAKAFRSEGLGNGEKLGVLFWTKWGLKKK